MDQFSEHAPGPRGSPQRPQGPGIDVDVRGLAAFTAKVDRARSRSVPWQAGHSGVVRATNQGLEMGAARAAVVLVERHASHYTKARRSKARGSKARRTTGPLRHLRPPRPDPPAGRGCRLCLRAVSPRIRAPAPAALYTRSDVCTDEVLARRQRLPPQRRHHRARRPRQDDPGGRAAAPERHVPRERARRRARDGQHRPRARARHHHPRQEHRGPLQGPPHQHRRHPRPRRLRRRGRAHAVDGGRRGPARGRVRGPAAADPLRAAQGARAPPGSGRRDQQDRPA